MPPEVAMIWIPVRNQCTEVDYVAFEAVNDRKIERLTDILKEWEDEWDEHLEEAEAEAEKAKAEVKPEPTFLDKLKFWR